MLSRAIKGHLACPLAVIVAAGLVIAPINSGSVANSPRFVEFSAVRLQAEATNLIAGVADSTAAKTAAALPGAAAAASVTAAATAEPCYYPCTIFDKFLDGLPPEIRSILLPPLITLAAVIGAILAPVLLVTSLVFDWPYELGPAAANRPEDPAGPAEAGDPDDNAATALQADPVAPAAVPGAPAADGAEGGPVIVGRVAERTAADAPAEAPVPAPDAAVPAPAAPQSAEPQTAEPQTAEPQTAEPQTAETGSTEPEVTEQNADTAVVTEPRPDSTEAVVTDLTEMTQPRVASGAAEVEATDATAVADKQPAEAATHSATEAPAAADSPRAAKRSAR